MRGYIAKKRLGWAFWVPFVEFIIPGCSCKPAGLRERRGEGLHWRQAKLSYSYSQLAQPLPSKEEETRRTYTHPLLLDGQLLPRLIDRSISSSAMAVSFLCSFFFLFCSWAWAYLAIACDHVLPSLFLPQFTVRRRLSLICPWFSGSISEPEISEGTVLTFLITSE